VRFERNADDLCTGEAIGEIISMLPYNCAK
jgi:hypothetical protein